MAVFKCKMCGAPLNIEDGKSIVECEYCGTKQTLPRLDDEKRSNLYDRANHFRRNNDFDKAEAIYEKILEDDNTDAEAYWSLVLCHYGIEYVEDPKTHKRIPTVNRAQYSSVLADENYRLALQYADEYQKAIYEDEAKQIDAILKGILSISRSEEPFDVFICYKETDSSGKRTYDSVLANEIYHQLTNEGFKVFFAKITLENKLGSAYEPYIFAALNSAKVMIVLGTKAEYFNAPWVKNEWSRFLALMRNGADKVLIPAFKDMDPYDLPEEFSHLQAQDMSKLGFMQDIIHGIKKILEKDSKQTTVINNFSSQSNSSALLKRMFIFLEDGDFVSTNDYAEKVLDIDPENAEAYLGKLLAELKITDRKDLSECEEPINQSNNFQKAYRFGNEKLRNELKTASELNKQNIEETRLKRTYEKGLAVMNSASVSQHFLDAAKIFASITGFKDSDILCRKCQDEAQIASKNEKYNEGCNFLSSSQIGHIQKAIEIFEELSGWKDSTQKVYECHEKIEKIKAKAEEERLKAERMKKTNILIGAILAAVVVIIIIAVVIANSISIINDKKERNGLLIMVSGDESYCIVTGIEDQSLSEIIIPDTYKGLPVTEIKGEAFANCSGLTSVTIGENVRTIGKYAFENCIGLRGELKIPNKVTSIGEYAFHWCSGLTNVTIGSNVKTIDDKAFSGCRGLTSVTIGENLQTIGEYAFENCSRLTSVIFKNQKGWQVSIYKDMTASKSLDLGIPEQNAEYLKSTYYYYYWTRET